MGRGNSWPTYRGWPWLTVPLILITFSFLVRGEAFLDANPTGIIGPLVLREYWGHIYLAAAAVVGVCTILNRWIYKAQVVAGAVAIVVALMRAADIFETYGWSGRALWAPHIVFATLCLFLFINPQRIRLHHHDRGESL